MLYFFLLSFFFLVHFATKDRTPYANKRELTESVAQCADEEESERGKQRCSKTLLAVSKLPNTRCQKYLK